MTIRTRFAPSPTGYLHVGGIRTALFAYLVAQQAGGQFVLRLEDTDKKREVAGSAEHLITSLKTLGIIYDEGPDAPGAYGPYRQSERLEVYRQYAQQLIDTGRAYADPYSPEEIQQFREQAQAAKQPFLYRNHRPDNPPAWDGSTPLRFKSEPATYHWHDEVMGDLTARPENIDDFILIKSDGYPTYNFAHIVDDLEMHITHVIRGQEFISSMPNYLALYEALGFDMEPASVQTAQESAAAKPARTTSEQPSHPEGSAFPAERGQEDSNWRPRVPEGGDGREEGRGNEADPTRAASDNHDTDEHSALPAEVGQDKLVISDRPYARGVMGGDGGEETISRAATDNRQSSGYSAFPAEVGQGEWQLAVRPYTRGLMGGGGGEARPTRTGIEQRSGGDGREEGRGSETAGKKLPIFAHMPHIMNEQGNKKLGKRDGAKDVLDYIKSGYLPEALVSFIATLGWNDGTEQEIFTRDELIKTFSLDRIQRSGARFDEKRLLWMNGHFIRQLPLDELATRVKPYWPEAAAHADDAYKMRVLALAQDRLKTLCDLAGLSEFFFTEPTPDLALLTSNKQLKKLSVETQQQLLQTAHDALSNIEDWHAEHIQTRLNELLEQTGQKPGTLFSLIRIATTWAPFSPQLDDTLALLGRDKTLARLAQAIRLIAA